MDPTTTLLHPGRHMGAVFPLEVRLHLSGELHRAATMVEQPLGRRMDHMESLGQADSMVILAGVHQGYRMEVDRPRAHPMEDMVKRKVHIMDSKRLQECTQRHSSGSAVWTLIAVATSTRGSSSRPC